MFYEIVDSLGQIVYSNISDCDGYKLFSDSKENCSRGGYKQVYRDFPFGNVRLLSDLNNEALSTAKIATRTAMAYASLSPIISDIKKTQETQYSIFSHNLVTTHSRLQDEIESIISEDKLARALTYAEQVSAVKKSLQSDIDAASESVFEIAKRIIDLQAQITGFKVLSGEIKPDIWPQNIKKVLLNIIYPYYDDFRKMDVGIKIYIDDTVAVNNLVPLDYKVFNIALHHFLNNIVKYAFPYSHVDIRFDAESKELSFDMISIRIEKDELDKLFDLKVSGKNSKGLSGDGIGMFMVKKALDLLNAEMIIEPDYSIARAINDRNYTKNTFIFQFT